MRTFQMCDACRAEYEDPTNRRFHAQPISCPHCGPKLSLHDREGNFLSEGSDKNSTDEIFTWVAGALSRGEIVALLGMGGAQLLVDATKEYAVRSLRLKKGRDGKPFAIMLSDMAKVESLCEVSPTEKEALDSSSAPIVLLKPLEKTRDIVAPSVTMHSPWLGVMLPTTPLHCLLLDVWDGIPVVTSGNISGDPLCITPEQCIEKLKGVADIFLMHDRPILRAVDDSVMKVLDDAQILLRRARGFAPLPLPVVGKRDVETMLSLGGQLKNSVAWYKDGKIITSQHLGDLESMGSYDGFRKTIEEVGYLIHAEPKIIVHDMHPDYASSVFGEAMRQNEEVKVRAVQHHLAHVCACALENEVTLPALGVAWDGVGLSENREIWGGEFFVLEDDA